MSTRIRRQFHVTTHSLSKRRGRPKKTVTYDKGTDEFREKKFRGFTEEPLDLCLKLGVISADQHWAGLHLRWLYSLRHGVPGVKMPTLGQLPGKETKESHSETWLAAREQEYNMAVKSLASLGYKRTVLNTCIFHRCPNFIQFTDTGPKTLNKGDALHEMRALKEALTYLVMLWIPGSTKDILQKNGKKNICIRI